MALRAISTANLRTSTKILDFGGFDSGRILIIRGGIPRPIGNLQESLSQAILEGIISVGRLGVFGDSPPRLPTLHLYRELRGPQEGGLSISEHEGLNM